ncbi:hypothetical protein VP409E501_P0084 [Vibrio phage 409E50-1]|nr:hypothetical protein VP521E561_P0084 [Vibrio phage 521E56-1]CAH9013317.1 hypothetical protein VP384E501_P0084 [Vibrio phage 384E50-1]CAH9013322.1 hypothetical protein VP409E501_P0084 [Vibrio phage 409E50-1]CAH9013338.1 hypothetical protein VP402E501_P0084 [Vibrio phage 402E50-1]CAH9013946.1 hypothetical protein VP405E501_P0084 [Vibrio phage 405E50-1]CAH9014010.1 hypothetical protein VP413E501_P0084 [Vibrio phage 413E50-1]
MTTKVNNRMIDGAAVNVKDFGAVGDGVADDTAALKAAVSSLQDGDTLYLGNKHRIRVTDRTDPRFEQTSAFFSEASNIRIIGPCEITQEDNGENVSNLFLFLNPENVYVENVSFIGYGDHIDDATSNLYSGYLLGSEGVHKNFGIIGCNVTNGLGGIRSWYDNPDPTEKPNENLVVQDCLFNNVRYPLIATDTQGITANFTALGVHRAVFAWNCDGGNFEYTVANCFPSLLRLTDNCSNMYTDINHIRDTGSRLVPEDNYSNNIQLAPTGDPVGVDMTNIDININSNAPISAIDLSKSTDSNYKNVSLTGKVTMLRTNEAAIFLGNNTADDTYQNLKVDLDVDVTDPGDGSGSGVYVAYIQYADIANVRMNIRNQQAGGRGLRLIGCDKTFVYGTYHTPSVGLRFTGMGSSVLTGHIFSDSVGGILRDDPQGANDTVVATVY